MAQAVASSAQLDAAEYAGMLVATRALTLLMLRNLDSKAHLPTC